MHPHHKLALLKARAQFRRARNTKELSLNAYEVARKRWLNIAGYYGYNSRAANTQLDVVRNYMMQYRIDVDSYIAAGEILVCVERMLAKA